MLLSELVEGKCQTREVVTPRFDKAVDVIVCGLGTAGSLAALYCAESGLSVLGVEPMTCVGGTHSAGGVVGNYFGCPGGRYLEIDQEINTFAKRYTATAAEGRKLVVEQAMVAQGVEMLFEASVCGVYLEGNTVVGIRVLTEQGILACGATLAVVRTAEG